MRKTLIDDKLLFLQIKDSKDLVLQMYFKTFIDKSDSKDNIIFINELYKQYHNDPKYIELLGQMHSIQDIPVELISKYYIKMYTIEGNFYKNMKNQLLAENFDFYWPYIKTLYESLEKDALKQCIDKELYSAQFLSEIQIKNLQDFKDKRENINLPISLVFSKNFISFSKSLSIAENFFNISKKNAILTIIKVDKNYNLFTHADIESFSDFKEEEVLFFPFSAFGINNFSYNYQKNRYELQLIYLGKYIKNNQFKAMTDKLPDNNFKTLFNKAGLIKKEPEYNLDEIKIKEIANKYDTYTQSKKKKCNKKYFLLFLLAFLALFALFKKKSDSDESKTTTCQEGFYLDTFSSKCLPCSIGEYSKAGSKYCSRCSYGQSSYGNSSSCFNCSGGTYSDYYHSECTPCKAGTYSPIGSSSCTKCPSGKFSIEGSEKCINCNAGYFSNEASKTCQICEPGTFSNEGSSKCLKYPNGTYSNIYGSI